MKKTLLFTGVGGGGTNNLIESFRQCRLPWEDYTLIGTNLAAEVLAKSPLEENYLLPVATDAQYEPALRKLIEQRKVDLVIPNNDREVGTISEIRDRLGCRVFLPDVQAIATAQDKHLFYECMTKANLPMAQSRALETLRDIPRVMKDIGGEKFWIRPRRGSGSRGATWIRNPEQAEWWIRLWCDLRGYSVEDFQISEFLPGRDYAFQSVWKDGRMVVGKLVERLEYFFGANRLSGMSSTPAIARTLRDEAALEMIFRAVKALPGEPHGNFNFDLKGRADGTMCVTECNIGRFCMITPIFDRTGKHSTVEMYVRSAFGEDVQLDEPLDIEEDMYLLRELDTLPTIISGQKLRTLSTRRI
ncbi:MAG: hypothetical protein JXA11_13455 [Phycisphaerae bacterium]|nr:hypothetical protein [Phycisphaerae bacterium]